MGAIRVVMEERFSKKIVIELRITLIKECIIKITNRNFFYFLQVTEYNLWSLYEDQKVRNSKVEIY